MTVADVIAEARRELDAGHDKAAARLLTDAAYRTHDPALEEEIAKLAEQGLSKAGFFGKGRWEEIIRVARMRAGGAQQG